MSDDREGLARTHTRITVDGTTYASLDDMPPAVRAKYERVLGPLLVDRDGNGVPDVLESGEVDGTVVTHVTTRSVDLYDVGGRRYTSLTDMPADVRDAVARLTTAAGRAPPGSAARPGTRGGLHVHLTWGQIVAVLATVAVILLVVGTLM